MTEGASSNAWIVDSEGRLITRQIDNAILRGVTRTTLIDLLRREGIELVERPFTVEEAQAAREAFITSATNFVMPVVRIDGKPIGNGAPGLLSLKLRAEFHSAAEIADALTELVCQTGQFALARAANLLVQIGMNLHFIGVRDGGRCRGLPQKQATD